MPVFNANELLLYLSSTSDGTFTQVGHLTSADLTINDNHIDVTDKASNSWKQIISGQKDWQLTGSANLDFDAIASAFDHIGTGSITSMLLGGLTVHAQFGRGNARFIGEGLFSTNNLTGGTDDKAEISFTLMGNGELTYDSDVTS